MMGNVDTMDSADITATGVKEILSGFFRFQYLAAAVESDIVTQLAERPGLTFEELRAALGFERHPARALVAGCLSIRLIREEEGRFFAGDVAAALFSRRSLENIRSIVLYDRLVVYRGMGWFYESLVENRNVGLKELPGQSTTVYGRLSENPGVERVFIELMNRITERVAQKLARDLDLSDVKSLLDIGGGSATVAIELVRHWPELLVTIGDLPSVIEAARQRSRDAELESRVIVTAIDAFSDDFPTGFDVVLFCHFLEIWDEEKILSCFKKAYNSLRQRGSVVIVSPISDYDIGVAAQFSAYFHTIASGTGLAYSLADYERWLNLAGFSVESKTQFDTDCILLARKL